jgi:hypothetical protein
MTPTSAVPSTPGARPWAAATQTEAAGPANALAPVTSSGPTMEISSWLAASRPKAASERRGQGSSGGVARAEAASTALWPRRSGPGGPARALRAPGRRRTLRPRARPGRRTNRRSAAAGANFGQHTRGAPRCTRPCRTQRTRCTPEGCVAAALLCAHIRNSDAHPLGCRASPRPPRTPLVAAHPRGRRAPSVADAHHPWRTRTLRHHAAQVTWTSRTVRAARRPRKVRDVAAKLSTGQ